MNYGITRYYVSIVTGREEASDGEYALWADIEPILREHQRLTTLHTMAAVTLPDGSIVGMQARDAARVQAVIDEGERLRKWQGPAVDTIIGAASLLGRVLAEGKVALTPRLREQIQTWLDGRGNPPEKEEGV